MDRLRPSSCQGCDTKAQAVQPLMKRINQEGAAAAPRLPSASRLPDPADAAAQTRRASEQAALLRWRHFAINLLLAASLKSVTVICASKTKQNKQFPSESSSYFYAASHTHSPVPARLCHTNNEVVKEQNVTLGRK